MPSLNWIGKEKVVNHHLDVPFHTLKHVYGFRSDDENDKTETHSGNKIIHGDNLVVLKALLPEYEGKVDCIYIDPPYNTGEEKWAYNDNVNDPHLKKWLEETLNGEHVGTEGEDLSRHDKWLCMMFPRLRLLRKLLSPKGVIFISIDDNEFSNLKCICDDIFGCSNFVATFIWEKRKNRENRKVVSYRHDYILCYSFDAKKTNRTLNLLPMSSEAIGRYQNPDNDPRGLWKSDPATAQAGHATEKQFYTLVAPNGKKHELPKGRCWLYTEDVMKKAIDDGRIWFGVHGNNVPRKKTYLNEKERGLTPETILFADDVATNEIAKNELKQIFSEQIPFTTPKPYQLISHLLQLGSHKDSIILDSFAGSGATAHAVLNLNKQDGGNRKFILCEMLDYAETITAERVRRIISGYKYTGETKEEIFSIKLTPQNLSQGEVLLEEAMISIKENIDNYDNISNPQIVDSCLKVFGTKVVREKMEGLGGSFDFYELGETIFDPVTDNLNDNADIEQIRRYVWYCETNTAYKKTSEDAHPYLLGSFQLNNYYFYYIKGEETCLDWEFLNTFTQKDKADMYIIYADRCILTEEEMMRLNIRFKKIPRDIKRV